MTTDGAKVLHIYAQAWEHMDAHIIGNTEGLMALKAAIEKALIDDKGISATPSEWEYDEVMVSDGEGYQVFVMRRDGEWPEVWCGIDTGYTSETCPHRPEWKGPEDVLAEMRHAK